MKTNTGAILIAEDDDAGGLYLQQLLKSEGYKTELAKNGREALEMYRRSSFDVVISDLMMPEMDGRELLHELVRLEDPPVFLLETGSDDRETIVDLIMKGASDYYIKPIQKDQFLPKVHKAIETARIQKARRKVDADREHRLDKNLEWNMIKERMVSRTYNKFDKMFFSSLKSCLTQGAGFGSTVSLIALIQKTMKQDGDFCMVRSDLMNMLISNSEFSEKSLSLITEIHSLFDRELDLQPLYLEEFFKSIRLAIMGAEKYSKIRAHHVYFNDIDYLNHHGEVRVDWGLLERAFLELFINACKFSVPGSEIYVFMSSTKDHVFISFLNRPDPGVVGGTHLKKDAENLIFEPFYRLANFVYEDYGTTDFGLGLCFVDKVVRKNNGSIELTQIRDDSGFHQQPSNLRVCFEVSLPLYSDFRQR